MAKSINDAVVKDDMGPLCGIIREQADSGDTKTGKTWIAWDVKTDSGEEMRYLTFGDRGNGEARAKIGQRVEFYKNGGWCNMREPTGQAPKQAKLSRQESIEEMHDHKLRSMCLAYAKDLCVADVIKYEDIEKTAEGFVRFISSPNTPLTPQSDDSPADDLDTPF